MSNLFLFFNDNNVYESLMILSFIR